MLATILALAMMQPKPVLPTAITPSGSTIKLELAISDEERATGLMFRDFLPDNRGMLFLFGSNDQWSIWMKNCFIALDIVWLDERGVVIDVKESAPPCKLDPCPSYAPLKPAYAVLELAGGSASKHGVRAGATLTFTGVAGYPTPPKK
jgi:uncharacterized membrane protein (UPF0127 family)